MRHGVSGDVAERVRDLGEGDRTRAGKLPPAVSRGEGRLGERDQAGGGLGHVVGVHHGYSGPHGRGRQEPVLPHLGGLAEQVGHEIGRPQ